MAKKSKHATATESAAEVQVWEPDADTPHWQARQWLEAERRSLQAQLAEAQAALRELVDALKYAEDRQGVALTNRISLRMTDAERFLKTGSVRVPRETTTHYVTVMPSIGDKVRVRKDREQESDGLIELQSHGTVGQIVGFDGAQVRVEFAPDNDWWLTMDEVEIVELGRAPIEP